MKLISNTKNIFNNFIKTDNLGISLILIVSIFLRFYHFTLIPFNTDELSALYRARFNNFHDLIYNGVLIDGHPAGVQVFIYYWIKCFGNSEFVVKLPFMIMGVLSVYLTYRIAKTWFNSTVGLIASAYISTLQFTVMFSQIARPYSSGLFLALLTVYFWTHFIFNHKNKKTTLQYLIGFVFFGALSAYNHHFNLLFLLIISISGLYFIKKKNLTLYIVGGVSMLLLYIPHLQIFFYQLHVGGVGGKDGWLGAPDYTFPYQYLKFIFHYSKLEIIFTFLLVLTGIVLFIRNYKSFDKTKFNYIILSFFWVFLPLFIGFYYSRMVAPVLQFSVLIFSFPFMIICLFSFFPEVNKYFKTALISLILLINIYTLSVERKYYQLFYHQGYRECALQIKQIYDESHKNIPVLVNGYGKFFMGYYEKLYNTKFNCTHFNIDDITTLEFSKFVKEQTSDEIILAGIVNTPLYFYDIIRESYPCLIKKSMGYGYEMFYFSKHDSNIPEQKFIYYCNDFKYRINKGIIDSKQDLNKYISSTYSYGFNNNKEWGPTFSTPIYNIISNKYNNLHISFKFYPKDSTTNPLLVICTQDTLGNTINWQGIPLKTLFTSYDDVQNLYYAVRLADFNLKDKNTLLKVFIWNKNKEIFDISDIEIWTEEGNRYIYSLYYDFK